MPTEKQVRANRENAEKSTGPKSAAGKARVSRNALKHGLFARELLIVGENRKQFEVLREDTFRQLAPEGQLEEILADRVVAMAWRLGRALRLERDTIQQELWRVMAQRAKSPGSYAGDPLPTSGTIAVNTLRNENTYDKLFRLEAHIERGFYRALHELQRVQAARKGGQVALPLAVDVDVAGLPAAGSGQPRGLPLPGGQPRGLPLPSGQPRRAAPTGDGCLGVAGFPAVDALPLGARGPRRDAGPADGCEPSASADPIAGLGVERVGQVDAEPEAERDP